MYGVRLVLLAFVWLPIAHPAYCQNKRVKSKYTYEFSLESKHTNSTFEIIKHSTISQAATLEQEIEVSGTVYQEYHDTTDFASYCAIYFKDTDSTYSIAANLDGAFKLKIPFGNYEIKIQYPGYEPIVTNIRIDSTFYLHEIQATLRPRSILTNYHLYCKNKKTKEDLEKIKDCLLENNNSENKIKCTDCIISEEI